MARAAVRPAAPVRLGRGGEPPGLISPWCLPPSRARQAPAPGSIYDPNDDTDVTSGTTDGAQMETTSPPSARYNLREDTFQTTSRSSLIDDPLLQALSEDALRCNALLSPRR